MSSPQVPRAFRGITHLGAPVRVFSPWRNAVVLLAPALLFLGVLGLLWRVNQSDGVPFSGAMWGALGLWTAISVGFGYIGIRRLKVWGVVYEDGFGYSRGGQVMAFRWEDVVTVSLLVAYQHYCHAVETATGDRFASDGNPDRMGKMMRDRSFPVRRQRLGEAFERGDTVDFGPLTITRAEGIRSGDKVFPWHQIKSLRIRSGAVVLSMKDDGFFHAGGINWAVPQIPNLDVLLDLAREAGVDASRDSVTALL